MKTAVGATFGSWRVVAPVDANHVLCVCRCGTERRIHRSNLTSRKTRSCGCMKSDLVSASKRGHRMSNTLTYRTWSSMLTRCRNPKSKSYPRYGGRGIKVCERWSVFENFLADMGEKPAGMSIERIDVNGNYEPSNCKWATVLEQSRNTSRTRLDAVLVSQIRSGEVTTEEVMRDTGACRTTVSAARTGRTWGVL